MKIAIIGGGVMGLSCAWRLSLAGASVELFEGRACGQGATHAALGALWPASPLVEGPLQNLHRESLWQFQSFIAELSKYSGIPVTFLRLGRLELLNSEKAALRAQDEAAHANRLWPSFSSTEPTMQVLLPDDAAVLQPGLVPPQFAAVACRATAQVHVTELLASLRAACLQAGVVIREHTPIAGLEDSHGRIAALRTHHRLYEADVFLATAGAWTPLISRILSHVAPVRPVKGQGMALKPPPGLILRTIIKSGSAYLIPWQNPETGEGEILVGSTTEPEAGYDETPTDMALQTLSAGALAILPALKDAPILREWAGLRPQNPAKGHPPIMGAHPQFSNLHVCTAHYKTGIGLAPLVSKLMAQSIVENKSPPQFDPFLPRVPP